MVIPDMSDRMRPNDDPAVLYTFLYRDAVDEAEADGTPLAIPAAVDRVLARHDVGPDLRRKFRDRVIRGVTKLVDFPCPADFGPTLQCRFMQGHLDEGLDHEPTGRMYEPIIEEIDEYLYLREVDPDVQP